jgi:hypothetical protein
MLDYWSFTGLAPCSPCPAGQHQPLPGSTSCVACPLGNPSCMRCPVPGQFVFNSGAGLQCKLCPAGSVSNLSISTSCKSCAAGAYVPEGSGGSCQDYRCPAGLTDDDSDASTPCVSCVQREFYEAVYVPPGISGACSNFICPPGTFSDNSKGDVPCRQCPNGTFSNAGAQKCFQWSECGSDIVRANPTASSDRQCFGNCNITQFCCYA